jgi:hypothetical protein
MKKSTKKSLVGVVGTATARSLSGRTDFEAGTEGTRPEKSRTHGNTLVHDHSRQSDHSIRDLTKWETHSGQKDIRVRKGSPTLGAGKK